MPSKIQTDSTITDGNISNDGNMNEFLKEAFKLVEQGPKEIKLFDEFKNVVLVLGATGAGKSTFTQWIAGNDSKLMAREVACGEFLISDEDGRIGKSTINSETTFPELVVDNASNTAFYDCPGFGDTRGTSYDLAITYLIKKVADYADKVKMIFVIRYPSVRKGVDREDFMRLMKHATSLVKDIEKFRKSIALVITKVDNATVKKGGNYTLITDESIIGAIADFLLEVKQDLQENLRNQFCTEAMHYKNALKTIDILLTKTEETFTRMGLFRRPEELLTLDKSDFHQISKKRIQKMIHETLDFTDKDVRDFGYGLSEKSKNDINDIVEDINENFWFSLKEIARLVEEHFRGLDEDTQKKIQLLEKEGEITDADLEKVEIISSKFGNGPFRIKELIKTVKGNRDLEQIVSIIKNTILLLDIPVPSEIMSKIDQGKYLNFLQIFYEKELNTRPWEEIFKGTLLFFKERETDLKSRIETTVEKISDQILEILNILKKTIREDYNKNIPLFDIGGLLQALNKERDAWFSKIEEIKTLNNIKTIVEVFCNYRSTLGVNITEKHLSSFEMIKKYILYLEILSDRTIKIPISAWVLTLQDIIKMLQEFECWYKFLFDLYAKFSEYRIQVEKHLFNVKNIDDWGKSGKMKEIEINFDNFDSFTNKITSYKIAEYIEVKKIELSEMKLQELNHILGLTIRNKAKVDSTETTLTIQGDYISLKNIFGSQSTEYVESKSRSLETLLASSKLKTIIVYSNTIFIDRDLELVGRMLTVVFMAKNWEIIGSRKIDLRGSQGDKSITKSVHSIKNDCTKANDGAPGRPGGPGGNFLGIGENFINGENLIIFSDGGEGGAGEKGQDGKDGKDGVSKTVFRPPNETEIFGSVLVNSVAAPVVGVSYLTGAIFGHEPLPLPVTSLGETITIGEKGGNGQEGGDGGRGGEGGYPGKITLLKSGNSSGIRKSSNKGETGEDGLGGVGGRSGMNAPGLTRVPSVGDSGVDNIGMILPHELFNPSRQTSVGSNEYISSGRDSPARDGRAGANKIGLIPARSGPMFNDFESVLNGFKKFLEQNLNDRFKKAFLQKSFFEYVNNLKYYSS